MIGDLISNSDSNISNINNNSINNDINESSNQSINDTIRKIAPHYQINNKFVPLKIEPYRKPNKSHWRAINDDSSEYVYVLTGITFLLSSRVIKTFDKLWTDDQGYIKITAYTPTDSYLLMYHGIMDCYYPDSDLVNFEEVRHKIDTLLEHYLEFGYDQLMALVMEASL